MRDPKRPRKFTEEFKRRIVALYDGGSEFRNAEIDAPLSAFGVERSVSRPGSPHDNTVVESTSRVLKRELVRRRPFASEEHPRTELFVRVN